MTGSIKPSCKDLQEVEVFFGLDGAKSLAAS